MFSVMQNVRFTRNSHEFHSVFRELRSVVIIRMHHNVSHPETLNPAHTDLYI